MACISCRSQSRHGTDRGSISRSFYDSLSSESLVTDSNWVSSVNYSIDQSSWGLASDSLCELQGKDSKYNFISQSHIIAMSESEFVVDLCTCGNRALPWCFIHEKVNENQVCNVNKADDFGFMCQFTSPVPLFRPGKVLTCDNLTQWACEAHAMVAASGLPNYQYSRIKVPTELKIDNWRALCGNYKDQKLLDYLEYGFPLCVNKQALQYNTDVTNYQSAEEYPHDMLSYFNKELSHKAIVGPCHGFPFPVHFSPYCLAQSQMAHVGSLLT